MISFRRLLVATALVACASVQAEAAATITTPALLPPASGSLLCDVVNTKDAPVSFTVDLISTTGGVVTSTDGDTSYPSGNPLVHLAISTSDFARFCRVTVTSGNRKHLRVSLQVRDSSGFVMAALEGR